MRPDWVRGIQFRFEMEDGWLAIGGQINGMEISADRMMDIWAMGELLEVKFVR